MAGAPNRTCDRCGKRERGDRLCTCPQPKWRNSQVEYSMLPRRRQERLVMIGVLLPERLFEKMEAARGELDRDEWCIAAVEGQLARVELLKRSAFVMKRRKSRALKAARSG